MFVRREFVHEKLCDFVRRVGSWRRLMVEDVDARGGGV